MLNDMTNSRIIDQVCYLTPDGQSTRCVGCYSRLEPVHKMLSLLEPGQILTESLTEFTYRNL